MYGYADDPDGVLGAGRYTWAYRAGAWGATGATGGIIPTDGGQVCVWAGADAAVVAAAGRGGAPTAFATLLRAVSPDLADRVAGLRLARPLRRFPGMPAVVRRPHGPGWALVGDAGAFRDPITAHGISDALRDAALLAGAVTALGHAPSDTVLDAALADYAAARDALAGPVLDATEAIAGLTWDHAELRAHLFALSDAMKAETRALAALDPLPIAA